jgi:hypothetical protein
LLLRDEPWPRRLGALAFAIIALTAFYVWTYGDFVGRFFFLDDFWELREANNIHIGSPLDLLQFFRPVPFFLLYRPFSTLTYFYAIAHLFGNYPPYFHATQITFHILNSLLVYAIADRLLLSRPFALATAFVYATAPGHAIAVCWIALFTMTGTAFFYFLGLWAWLQLAGRWRVPMTLLIYVVALLASEHAVTFPAALTLITLLFSPRYEWRRIVREQAAFYVIALAYVATKLIYMHYILPRTMPFALAGYGMSLEPLSILSHIGRYLSYGIDALYTPHLEDAPGLWAGVAVVGIAAIATVGVVGGWWTARPSRVIAFGLDLYVVALAPVIILKAHQQSYYIGIAGLGLALAVIGFANALPRVSRIAPVAVVGALLFVHFNSTAALVRTSLEFQLFEGGSESAANWLYRLSSLRWFPTVQEVVVPKDPVTARLFDDCEAHRIFLCASYRVRTTENILAEFKVPGRVIFKTWHSPRLLEPPGWRRSWEWLTPCP